MADTDSLLIDTDSATYTSEALVAGQGYDVHWRFTDSTNGKFNQGSVSGYRANSDGALSVSLSFAQLGVKNHDGELKVWIHTLPPLTFDDEGNVDPNYDHNFSHVLDKGDGDLAEASGTITP